MTFDLRSAPSDESSLSLGKLCQHALLRSVHGEDGQSLASQILPLYLFPSLWSRENEYCKTEAQCSINLLLQAFGKSPYYEQETPVALRYLESRLPSFQEIQPPFLIAQLFQFNDKVHGAFVNRGEYVSLGAIRSSQIEIPAFGPQTFPLNDPKMFGVHRTESNWSSVSAAKEIWFDYECLGNSFRTNFIGVTSETPIYFVFYIKAKQAIVGNETFPPKSLQRYNGHSQTVTFKDDLDLLIIDNLIPTKMQLIPLAGAGCFWDSDYLIAYEILLHESKAVFQFS